jgi:hypothetical protein
MAFIVRLVARVPFNRRRVAAASDAASGNARTPLLVGETQSTPMVAADVGVPRQSSHGCAAAE